jgi:tetratricopeptide (TPR) repeat protein
MRSTRRAVVAAAAVLACTSAAVSGDYIQRKDGSFSPSFKGTTPQAAADFDASEWQVLDANLSEILYTIPVGGKAQTQKMPAAEVLEIWLEPKDYGPQWKDAAAALEAGDWKGAAARFRAIGDEKKGDEKKLNPVVRQRALLNAARALAGPGDAKSVADADAAYGHLLSTFPGTFYARSVWKGRWNMFMEAGMEEKAKAAIDELLKLAGVTDADKLEARYALSTIALKKAVGAKDQAGIQKCLDEYKTLAGETQGKKDLVSVNALARIGMGTCMLELGNAGEAKGIFEEMSQREGFENSVNAAAFNGLGECWYRQGNPQGFAEARRCFLRVQLLYADGAPPEAVAKAMYFAGDCFSRLMDSDSAKARALEQLNACISRFPSSAWATAARKLKANLK